MDVNVIVLSGTVTRVGFEQGDDVQGQVMFEVCTEVDGTIRWTEVWTRATTALTGFMLDGWSNTRIWVAGTAQTDNGETRITIVEDGLQLQRRDEPVFNG